MSHSIILPHRQAHTQSCCNSKLASLRVPWGLIPLHMSNGRISFCCPIMEKHPAFKATSDLLVRQRKGGGDRLIGCLCNHTALSKLLFLYFCHTSCLLWALVTSEKTHLFNSQIQHTELKHKSTLYASSVSHHTNTSKAQLHFLFWSLWQITKQGKYKWTVNKN